MSESGVRQIIQLLRGEPGTDRALQAVWNPVHAEPIVRAETIDGRRLNEDTYTVQIADQEGRLLSLQKSDLREFTVLTKSNMPSYKGELTPAEMSDLVSYLLTLKGQ